MNKQLDICEALFEEEKSFETLCKHLDCFLYECSCFSIDKETNRRVLKYLKRLNKEYGYFINYYFKNPFGNDYVYGPSNFVLFKSIYLSNKSKNEIEKEKKYFDSMYYFFNDCSYCGLIHIFNMLGFDDLLHELFIEIIIPILKNYQKQTSFCGNEIIYTNTKLKDFYLYNVLKQYILDYNIPVPDELNIVLEI